MYTKRIFTVANIDKYKAVGNINVIAILTLNTMNTLTRCQALTFKKHEETISVARISC